jgi:8-oxo-dGTP pyrophosphatase MutT (NUDIX family)
MNTYITTAWLQQKLPASMTRFAQQWRDESHRDLESYKTVYLADQPLGHVQGIRAEQVITTLQELNIGFKLSPGKLELTASPQELQSTLTLLGTALRQKGLIPGWRNEMHTLYDLNGLTLCCVERALFKVLGLCSQAIHVHAETENGMIWLGVRSPTKHENPGMLDNLTAGGIAANESIAQSITRELQEEAGLEDLSNLSSSIPKTGFIDLNTLLRSQVTDEQWHSSSIRVSRPIEMGWHHELMILCHLRMKNSWTPNNQDGEVAGFQLISPTECIKAVNNLEFTPDAALATALALVA